MGKETQQERDIRLAKAIIDTAFDIVDAFNECEQVDHFQSEIDLTRELIEVDALLTFQLHHDIQVVRGEDYQYICYIDKQQWGSITLTPMLAMVTAILDYTKANY